MRIRRLHLLLSISILVALLVFAKAAVPLFTRVPTQFTVATFTRGNLALTIPYHSDSQGSGRLVAELLNPEDKVLGRAERTVEIGKGEGAWPMTGWRSRRC